MIGNQVKFVVLKIQEENYPSIKQYRVSVDVVGTFDNLEDAKKCKDAKDVLNSIAEKEEHKFEQFRVQQIFFKSFVQADKKSA